MTVGRLEQTLVIHLGNSMRIVTVALRKTLMQETICTFISLVLVQNALITSAS